MLLKLVSQQETDIISALEQKLKTKEVEYRFREDPRVHKALYELTNASYTFDQSNWNLDTIEFLDDAWVTSYLMQCLGYREQAESIRDEFLQDFNPFDSINPVTKCFAYCEAIEDSHSIGELKTTTVLMREQLDESNSPIVQRAYPILNNIAVRRLNYLKRKKTYETRLNNEIMCLMAEGDMRARNFDFTASSDSYRKAMELAEYQLHDVERRDEIEEAMKKTMSDVAKNMGVEDEKEE